MKKIITLIILLTAAIQLSAQSMKEIVTSMPDSITPLLTKNNRLNLVDYIAAGQKAVERNLLGGDSEMTKLTDTRAVIKMTDSSTLDMKLLKNPTPSIGVITTMKAGTNTLVSIVSYYSLDWKLISTKTPSDFTSFNWQDDNEELESHTYDPLKLDNSEFKK